METRDIGHAGSVRGTPPTRAPSAEELRLVTKSVSSLASQLLLSRGDLEVANRAARALTQAARALLDGLERATGDEAGYDFHANTRWPFAITKELATALARVDGDEATAIPVMDNRCQSSEQSVLFRAVAALRIHHLQTLVSGALESPPEVSAAVVRAYAGRATANDATLLSSHLASLDQQVRLLEKELALNRKAIIETAGESTFVRLTDALRDLGGGPAHLLSGRAVRDRRAAARVARLETGEASALSEASAKAARLIGIEPSRPRPIQQGGGGGGRSLRPIDKRVSPAAQLLAMTGKSIAPRSNSDL